MKKVVSMWVAVMMLLQVSFGYTLTVRTSNGTMTREAEAGVPVVLGLAKRLPARYTVVKENVDMTEDGNWRQFTMPAEDVEIEIEQIKTVADMEVGDYVTYYPLETAVDLTSLTGFEHETLNPSLTTEWRVLSKDAEKVELVSADSVGDLTLSQESAKNSSGNFTSGNEEIMEQSKENYVNVVYILNTISEAYEKAGITDDSRGLGYNGSSIEQMDTDIYEISHEATGGRADFVAGEPYEDSNMKYLNDANILVNSNMMHSDDCNIWLASRHWYGYSSDGNDYSCFVVRDVASSGEINANVLFYERSDGFLGSHDKEYGVRPVVSLQSGIAMSGSGTTSAPWIICE